MRLHPVPDETIAGVGHEIRSRQRTCLDVVDACLARIDQWEPQVRAWVSVDRAGARARAGELDRELDMGRWRGPLHGIPLGIKDLVDVAGWPTAAGAPWLKNAVAAVDAPLVERLRAAGAVILGKTVTTQFACFDPPPTRNPWNLERTPGGSSSGSSAAVATGMCLGAIGSQTGGSITRPASFCGVAGCKPTFGLVPLAGVYPLSPSLDHGGPIARSVEDLSILLEALVDSDRAATWRASRPTETGTTATLTGPFSGAKVVRLGRLRGPFQDRAEPGALAIFEAALTLLARAGAGLRDITLPPAFDDVLRCHRTVMTREIGNHHRSFFAEHRHEYLPGVRGIVEEGFHVADDAYAKAKVHQRALTPAVVETMRDVDVLVCPAAVGAAPILETTGDPSFNAPWSYTGQPTVSFPIGLSAEGLPVAIQLIGRPHDEPGLFAAALWCEGRIAESQS
ncbi:MAG TPA: amidase [Planctomycetaceae bacterium]|jgi:aspartyl-tRNA(Asn)/glutamyl-tRNA(Gln) amidotransferase subunit A